MGKTIFLKTGKTFTFRNVGNVLLNETVVAFDYSAMSDGLSKRVTFFRDQIAGHSEFQENLD